MLIIESSERPSEPAPEDVASVPEHAEITESGLASRVLSPGTGSGHPGPKDRVKVYYSGWKTDGEMFDGSIIQGSPGTYSLEGVIAGWTEGLQLMVEGEKRRFWIPAELAYGESPARASQPAGMLVFDIELLAINP